jgi:predicted amidohydrolase
MKIAQIQFSPSLAAIEENSQKAESLLKKCTGSQLIILPELADTGYNFYDRNHAFANSKEIGKNPFVEMLIEQARKLNSNIVSGICEKENGRLYNSSLLISAKGIVGKYQKIHLFVNERDIFEEGKAVSEVFNMEGYRLGMQICFDYLFPEPWRILAENAADIIAHPSNLVTYNAFKVVPALSVMNKVFIATTNRTGADRDLEFAGRSFLTNPNGEIIAGASKEKEEILFSEVEPQLSRNKMITERNHVFTDRRPERYSLGTSR